MPTCASSRTASWPRIRLSADTFLAALQRFGAQGVTELTTTVGYYAMIGLVRNALEV
jgi:hypothetical protein